MKNDLGQVLQSTRSKKNMSLRDFGEYLGISHTYLDKLEKGVDSRTGKNISPTIETLSNIAKNLNIPLIDFMWECGYFGEPQKNKNKCNVSKDTVFDLEKNIKELNNKIKNANNVIYKNKILNKSEIQLTIDLLQATLEIIFKN